MGVTRDARRPTTGTATSEYLSNGMPANFGVDEFIASWDESEN